MLYSNGRVAQYELQAPRPRSTPWRLPCPSQILPSKHSQIYAEECAARSGFGISLTEIDNRRTTFEQYKKLLLKWHTMSAVRG